ncbi:dihydrofolate reductase family protein [Ruania alba]|uniref:Dihydrofolate reductase n=1 Tax=Ruania alba TaxID=648782 RepID=A0A1H5D3L9_9MICO|nr:dihydrofolate reductase family protein [Ruania alba]SED73475.1 Dihydrofolate reductase [Ruania alba]
MTENKRTIVANITLSLDGRTNGPGGDADMGWLVPHAITDGARDGMTRMSSGADHALLGRKNYEGFAGFWPGVADDENADPRDRAFSRWLNDVEKTVFSSTLTQAAWPNGQDAEVVDGDPASVVARLRKEAGGDVVVLASSSVIKALLEADAIDRLSINLCPELVGGGARLFEDGLPTTSWKLTDFTTSNTGAVWMFYDRAR